MKRSFIRWRPFHDLTGRTFGRLFVLAFYGYTEKGHRSQFLCSCTCGTVCIRRGNNLLSRDGKWEQSCGCARIEKTVTRNLLGKGIMRGPSKRDQKTT